MSVYFADSDGFCNCGNELLSWLELSDNECSACSGEEGTCFECGELFVADSETNLFCDNCLGK